MRRSSWVLLVALVCVTTVTAVGQRRPSQVPPQDEVLFPAAAYKKIPGWRLVLRSPADKDGVTTIVYYDPSRTERSGALAQVWIKREEKQGQSLTSTSLALEEFNCVSRKQRYRRAIQYDATGDVDATHTEATDWDYVIPDSVGEETFNVVCHNAPDLQETEMRAAAKFFQTARQQEKRGLFRQAKYNYYNALLYAGPIGKILGAIARLEKKDPEPLR